MRFGVTKKFEFEASHKLSLPYESPCTKIHGHSYKVEITIETQKLNDEGMVIDFTELKNVKEKIMNDWDHALIVSQHDPSIELFHKMKSEWQIAKIAELEFKNITAENMAVYIATLTRQFVRGKINTDIEMIEVSIWETSNNKATFRLESGEI